MHVAQTEFRATPLRDGDVRSGKVLVHTTMPALRYRWAAGVAIGKFLDGLKAGKLVGSHCGACSRTVVPPRAFCEMCFAPVAEYPELPTTGVVNTFVISWIAKDRSRLEKPVVPAVIDIDGTTKAGILHMIGGVDPKKVKSGMRVRAVWKPPEQRSGDITDILHFEPVKEGRR